jgi:hypothetical protein
MSTSDPVLYPAPAGTTEALRQDVIRTRQDLAETLGELSGRADVGAAVQRQAAAGAPMASAAAVGTGVYALCRWTPYGRWLRLGLAVAASTLAYLAVDRLSRSREVMPPPTVAAQGSPAVLEPSPDGGDVVDVLLEQHRDVQHLFGLVASADGADRRELFAQLVEALHRHEMAEQEIVHSSLHGTAGTGAAVAEKRVQEEADADRAIGALISRGTDDRHFQRDLAELKALVEAHAAHEEADEFPLIRAYLPLDQRQRMANQVRAAQAESW